MGFSGRASTSVSYELRIRPYNNRRNPPYLLWSSLDGRTLDHTLPVHDPTSSCWHWRVYGTIGFVATEQPRRRLHFTVRRKVMPRCFVLKISAHITVIYERLMGPLRTNAQLDCFLLKHAAAAA